jgi:hypothetical protein
LEEKIEEDKEVRKLDHEKLNKRKKTSMSALDHLVEKKEREAGKSLKEQVKWT